MRRLRSRGRKRTAATLRVEALQVSRSAEPSRLTPRLRLAARHGEHASVDRPQRTGALRRPPAARESWTRTRLPRCARRGTSEEGRVPAAPSLVPARVRGLKVGGRARQGQARGCGGAGRCGGLRPRARRPAGAAATLHVAWKTPGRRPLRGLLWAGVQRPRGAGSPRRGRARTPEAIGRPSAACGGHGSASETRRDQRGTGRRFRYGQKSAIFFHFRVHLFLGSGLCPRVLDHRIYSIDPFGHGGYLDHCRRYRCSR